MQELGRRTWDGIKDDEVFGRGAQLAYYFFFAIFPLAIFLIAVLGLVVGGSAAEQQLTTNLLRGVPSSASSILRDTVQHSIQASGGGKLTIGIVVALISASAGMVALMEALSAVYEVRDRRGFLKQRGIALALTVATGILMLIAIGLIALGGTIVHHVASGALYSVWNIAQYPVAVLFLILTFSLIYYFAPDVEHPQWHWITPGAAVGVVLWIMASIGLRVYLHFSNTYTATYGLLGAVMVLLLWFYVTGLAILVGAEVNAVIERASSGRPEGGHLPQRPADRVVDMNSWRRA